MHFFDLINQNYQELSEIDLQMGRYILDNPKQVQKMSAQEFAAVCLSSKSSAVRFAQKLGFTGFGELKNYLKWQNNEKEYGQALRFKKQLQDDIRETLDYTEQSSWREIYSRLDACQMVYVIFTGVTQQSQAAELQRLLVLIGKGVQCIPASSGNRFDFYFVPVGGKQAFAEYCKRFVGQASQDYIHHQSARQLAVRQGGF